MKPGSSRRQSVCIPTNCVQSRGMMLSKNLAVLGFLCPQRASYQFEEADTATESVVFANCPQLLPRHRCLAMAARMVPRPQLEAAGHSCRCGLAKQTCAQQAHHCQSWHSLPCGCCVLLGSSGVGSRSCPPTFVEIAQQANRCLLAFRVLMCRLPSVPHCRRVCPRAGLLAPHSGAHVAASVCFVGEAGDLAQA